MHLFAWIICIYRINHLPWWLCGKESICPCRRHRFDPWVRKIPWRRKWQPNPVFLPGKSHGQRSPAEYSPRSCKRVRHSLTTKQQYRLNHSELNDWFTGWHWIAIQLEACIICSVTGVGTQNRKGNFPEPAVLGVIQTWELPSSNNNTSKAEKHQLFPCFWHQSHFCRETWTEPMWAVHCLSPTPHDYPDISLQKYWHGWSSLPESAEYVISKEAHSTFY